MAFVAPMLDLITIVVGSVIVQDEAENIRSDTLLVDVNVEVIVTLPKVTAVQLDKAPIKLQFVEDEVVPVMTTLMKSIVAVVDTLATISYMLLMPEAVSKLVKFYTMQCGGLDMELNKQFTVELPPPLRYCVDVSENNVTLELLAAWINVVPVQAMLVQLVVIGVFVMQNDDDDID